MASNSSSNSTSISGFQKKTEFKVLNSVVFDWVGRNQKRAQIMTVDGKYFVSISGFWRPLDKEEFFPNGKCIFLNFGQWLNLLKEVDVIKSFIVDAINAGI